MRRDENILARVYVCKTTAWPELREGTRAAGRVSHASGYHLEVGGGCLHPSFLPTARYCGTSKYVDRMCTVAHESKKRRRLVNRSIYRTHAVPAERQILAAPEEAKEALGLAAKLALDFRYLTADGKEADSVIEGRTDAQRWALFLA